MNNIENIDSIIDKMGSNDEKLQEEGLEMAKKIKNIKVFCRPPSQFKSWDACANLLSSKTDDDLSYILDDLFLWLRDLNRPGALTIQERLKKYNHSSTEFKNAFNRALKLANNLGWRISILETIPEIEANKFEDELLKEKTNKYISEINDFNISSVKTFQNSTPLSPKVTLLVIDKKNAKSYTKQEFHLYIDDKNYNIKLTKKCSFKLLSNDIVLFSNTEDYYNGYSNIYGLNRLYMFEVDDKVYYDSNEYHLIIECIEKNNTNNKTEIALYQISSF